MLLLLLLRERYRRSLALQKSSGGECKRAHPTPRLTRRLLLGLWMGQLPLLLLLGMLLRLLLLDLLSLR